jgi:alpha-D-ribose 1-methylphosphonate 5-triphosphate synthase subunit PhnL
MNMKDWQVRLCDVSKSFVLHTQGSVRIPVLDDFCMDLFPGECLALTGRSGAGKSTVLRLLYGNYRCEAGQILVRHRGEEVDMTRISEHEIMAVRRETIGYVSQFLRVIPRIPALDLIMEPMLRRGADEKKAREKAAILLERLSIPERLWGLSPTTFSGGEQQRVNLARSFAVPWPVMILDEPTASLDAKNRVTVRELIGEAKASGTAIIGIFHDEADRQSVATRTLEMAHPVEPGHYAA